VVLRVSLVLLGLPDHKETQAKLAHQGLLVQLEELEELEAQVGLVARVELGGLDQVVHQDPQVLVVPVDLLGARVEREEQDQVDHRVIQGQQDHLDHLDHLGLVGRLVAQEGLVEQEALDQAVHQDRVVPVGRLEELVGQVGLGVVVLLDPVGRLEKLAMLGQTPVVLIGYGTMPIITIVTRQMVSLS
jgi:hypothetical protein